MVGHYTVASPCDNPRQECGLYRRHREWSKINPMSLRHRCLALALTLLVSHSLLAAHTATHAGKGVIVDCHICLSQAHDPHGLPPTIVAFAGVPAQQEAHVALAVSPREGVTFRAFLQRAPPSVS